MLHEAYSLFLESRLTQDALCAHLCYLLVPNQAAETNPIRTAECIGEAHNQPQQHTLCPLKNRGGQDRFSAS